MASWKNKLLIGFSLLVFYSPVTSQNKDIRPVIKCTSLSELSYKCEWNIALGVNCTCETRARWRGQWTLQMPDNHNGIASTRVIKVKWAFQNLQEIRVNVTRDNNSASETIRHDIKSELKPNITYRGSIMSPTSATLTWSTENGRRTYWNFHSQFKYGECDDETNETCEMFELPDKSHENILVTRTINDLKPGRFYKFGIRSRYTRPGNDYTCWTYVVNRTDESRPSKEVQIERQEDDTLLKWNAVPEESQNGKILGYTIFVNSKKYEDVDVNSTEWSLKGIDDGSYNICITAYNSAGESPINCQTVKLNSTKLVEVNPTAPVELNLTKLCEGINKDSYNNSMTDYNSADGSPSILIKDVTLSVPDSEIENVNKLFGSKCKSEIIKLKLKIRGLTVINGGRFVFIEKPINCGPH